MAAAAAAAAGPSIPSHSPSPRVRTAPVRVVARICPGGGPAGSLQVVARVPDPANSSSASVSFVPIINEATPSGTMTPRKHHDYKLDWCYLKNDSDTEIFQTEVKHLVDDMFCGDGRKHACVVTCGSTAKTQLVMGSEGYPGLLTMAMERILDCGKPIRATVRVSSYQVLQDSHVFDLLEPKDSEIPVREDGDGRTHLKGLSRVEINSIQKFQNLCYGCDKLQHHTKISKARGHRGFIIFVSKFDQNGKECSVAKMHFLELSDYINNAQKSHGGGFTQPNSKSLYAVMDVVGALNSHQSFIPYRKSKVTHILQDSLCRANDALLIACLDEVSCQDAVTTLSLASRSSQVVNDLSFSTKGCSKSVSTKNLSRSLLSSIQQRGSVLKKADAIKATQPLNANKRFETSMHSTKKSVNLVCGAKSILRGRTLFSRTTNSSKEDKKDSMTTAVMRPKEVDTSICMEIQTLPPIESNMQEKHDGTKNSVVSSEMQEVLPCNLKELASIGVKEEEDKKDSMKTVVMRPKEVETSICMEIQALPPIESNMQEKHDDTKNSAVSSEMREEVPCNLKELASIGVKEEDQSSSGFLVENFYADLGMPCSSNAADKCNEKSPANVIESCPKVSDKLREISNVLKSLLTTPLSIAEQKADILHAESFDIVEEEPKTPEIQSKLRHDEPDSLKARTTGIVEEEPKTPENQLKLRHAEPDSLKSRTTGIKKSLAQECLSFINSASREQLRSLKGIGEKRANYILELREESPEPLKEIDDLRSLIGMNKKEIKKMMSEMVLDSEMD